MIKKITIDDIKNINHMEFCIPTPGLHIVTGKNGSGKTTLFTCLSRIKNSNAFRTGFPASNGNDRLDFFSGYIQYEVDGECVKYSKRASGKWKANKQNDVLSLMGYPQVVNITTKDERVFTQTEITPRRNNRGDDWINEKLNQIFGTTKYSQMIRITTGQLYRGRGTVSADTRRRNIAYAIPTGDGKFYTERNFSFGEIVLLNLLYDIHNVLNGSLVLIDELELALHPSAQIRLLSCLREMADEKGLTILITTHSASLIRSQKDVILLEDRNDNGQIEVMYHCPPAKAIGAIGMREDTMPDIVVLVEDDMAKALFTELKRKYFTFCPDQGYLDIRVLEIGGYQNVINFYVEADNYVFYDNVYVTAYMDKDVETDIIPYEQYGNQEYIQRYHDNSRYLKFLPYTPEVLLVKTYIEKKQAFLQAIRAEYSNQQVDYTITEQLDFTAYEAALPEFSNQAQYNSKIAERGSFRKKCKEQAEKVATELSQQLNISVKEVYRYSYKFAVENIPENELNVRALLAQTIKRLR